jgi:hypothetical protein
MKLLAIRAILVTLFTLAFSGKSWHMTDSEALLFGFVAAWIWEPYFIEAVDRLLSLTPKEVNTNEQKD